MATLEESPTQQSAGCEFIPNVGASSLNETLIAGMDLDETSALETAGLCCIHHSLGSSEAVPPQETSTRPSPLGHSGLIIIAFLTTNATAEIENNRFTFLKYTKNISSLFSKSFSLFLCGIQSSPLLILGI